MKNIECLDEKCTGCSACSNVCPQKCIEMKYDEEGFAHPSVDSVRCINCGKCDRACPILNELHHTDLKKSYYGWHKNSEIRRKSSSGGIFTALATKIIDEGGAVFGAVYDCESVRVVHKCTDEVTIGELQKSKYVESIIGNTYERIKNKLDSGQMVMFCGTPCQCAGLSSFLDKTYNNLLICDFVCHGVPSSKIFKEHIQTLQKKFGEEIKYVGFRDKDYGWRGDFMHLKIETENRVWYKEYQFDRYFYGFEKDVFLRKSCYNCEFTQKHFSDITFADFWGYAKLNPKLNDEKGISLIITHTKNGEDRLANVQDVFNLVPLDWEYADYVYHRKDFVQSLQSRKNFFELYRKFGLKKAADKSYMKNYKINYVIYKMKKYIKTFLKYTHR